MYPLGMASKNALELAYDAGRKVMAEPPERRGVEACPFSAIDHPEEREAWLDGYSDALDDQEDLTAARKALKEARGDAK